MSNVTAVATDRHRHGRPQAADRALRYLGAGVVSKWRVEGLTPRHWMDPRFAASQL